MSYINLNQSLVEEHKLIKRMINVLEYNTDLLEKGGPISPEIVEQTTDFIRNFADKFHHAKEETILFKELVSKGIPEKGSPIEVMLTEHEMGRNFTRGLVQATEKIRNGHKEAVKEVISNAKSYAELLREHIDKEDNVLYPLAERIFTEDEKSRILNKYKKAELEKGGEATIIRYTSLVENLERSKK